MKSPFHAVAAILLTGGASRRMGRDKSQLLVDGVSLAVRTAELLAQVVSTAIEVGPGVSGLRATADDEPGQGPLGGIAAGTRALRNGGHRGSALVIACDLPFLNVSLLHLLAEWDTIESVVPVVGGRAQPLCARWCPRDLDGAGELFALGERSLRHLSSQPDVILLRESDWGAVATERTFRDVDSPDDARQSGIVP